MTEKPVENNGTNQTARRLTQFRRASEEAMAQFMADLESYPGISITRGLVVLEEYKRASLGRVEPK